MKQKFNRMPVTVYRSCKVMCLAGTLLLLGLFSSCSDKEEISSLRTGTFVDVTMKVASFDQIPFDVAQNGTKLQFLLTEYARESVLPCIQDREVT